MADKAIVHRDDIPTYAFSPAHLPYDEKVCGLCAARGVRTASHGDKCDDCSASLCYNHKHCVNSTKLDACAVCSWDVLPASKKTVVGKLGVEGDEAKHSDVSKENKGEDDGPGLDKGEEDGSGEDKDEENGSGEDKDEDDGNGDDDFRILGRKISTVVVDNDVDVDYDPFEARAMARAMSTTDGEGEDKGEGKDKGAAGDGEGEGEGEGEGDGEDKGDGKDKGAAGDGDGKGEGKGAAGEGEGKGAADKGEGKGAAGEGEGKGAADKGEGKGAADKGEGKGAADKGEGKGAADKGEGKGAAGEGEDKGAAGEDKGATGEGAGEDKGEGNGAAGEGDGEGDGEAAGEGDGEGDGEDNEEDKGEGEESVEEAAAMNRALKLARPGLFPSLSSPAAKKDAAAEETTAKKTAAEKAAAEVAAAAYTENDQPWKNVVGYREFNEKFLAATTEEQREGREPITGRPARASYVSAFLSHTDYEVCMKAVAKHLGRPNSRAWPKGGLPTGETRISLLLFFVTVSFRSGSDSSQADDSGPQNKYEVEGAVFDAKRWHYHTLASRSTISQQVLEFYLARVQAASLQEWFGEDIDQEYISVVLEELREGLPLEFANSTRGYYGTPTNDPDFAWDERTDKSRAPGLVILPGIMGSKTRSFDQIIQNVFIENPSNTTQWGVDQSSASWGLKLHMQIVLAKQARQGAKPRESIPFRFAEVAGPDATKRAASLDMHQRRLGEGIEMDEATGEIVGRGAPMHKHLWRLFKALQKAHIPGLTEDPGWQEDFEKEWQEASGAMVRDITVSTLVRDTPAHVDVPEEMEGGGDGAVVVNFNASETVIVVFTPHPELKGADGKKPKLRYVVLNAGDAWVMQGGYRQKWTHAVYRIFPKQDHVDNDRPEENRYILTLRAGTLSKDELLGMYDRWLPSLTDLQHPGEKEQRDRDEPTVTQPASGSKPTGRTETESSPRRVLSFAASETRPKKKTASPTKGKALEKWSSRELNPVEKANLHSGATVGTNLWIPGGPVSDRRYRMTPQDHFQPLLTIRSTRWEDKTPMMCAGQIGTITVNRDGTFEEYEITIGAVGIYASGVKKNRLAVVKAQRISTTLAGREYKDDVLTGSVNLGSSNAWWPYVELSETGHANNDFPDWAVTYMESKRPTSMSAWNNRLHDLLALTVQRFGDGEDDDEGDDDEGDDEGMDEEVPIDKPQGMKTGGRQRSAKAQATYTAAAIKRAAPKDKRGSKQISGSSAGQGDTKQQKTAATILFDSEAVAEMRRDFDEKLAKVKADAQRDEKNQRENFQKELERRNKQAATYTEARFAELSASLLQQQDGVQNGVRPKQDPKDRTFAEEMTENLVKELVKANTAREETERKRHLAQMLVDSKRAMAKIESTRQIKLAKEQGDMERDKRDQILMALAMAGNTQAQQLPQHEMGVTNHGPVAATGTQLDAQHRLLLSGIPQPLAITNQEPITTQEPMDIVDMNNAEMAIALADMKEKVKQAVIKKKLMKEYKEQLKLLEDEEAEE
jgi:hypothetical protein